MGSSVRGLTSLPESNGPVGSLNRLLSVLSARSANPLTRRVLGFAESSNDSESIFRSRDGEAPGEKEAEGSASETADVETKRSGLSTAPSAAAESAFPEDSIHRLRSKESSPRSLEAQEKRRGLLPSYSFQRCAKRVATTWS